MVENSPNADWTPHVGQDGIGEGRISFLNLFIYSVNDCLDEELLVVFTFALDCRTQVAASDILSSAAQTTLRKTRLDQIVRRLCPLTPST